LGVRRVDDLKEVLRRIKIKVDCMLFYVVGCGVALIILGFK